MRLADIVIGALCDKPCRDVVDGCARELWLNGASLAYSYHWTLIGSPIVEINLYLSNHTELGLGLQLIWDLGPTFGSLMLFPNWLRYAVQIYIVTIEYQWETVPQELNFQPPRVRVRVGVSLGCGPYFWRHHAISESNWGREFKFGVLLDAAKF